VRACTPRCPREQANHYDLDRQKASDSRIEEIDWQIRFQSFAHVPIWVHNGSYRSSGVIKDSKCAEPKSKFVLADYVKETSKADEKIVSYGPSFDEGSAYPVLNKGGRTSVLARHSRECRLILLGYFRYLTLPQGIYLRISPWR
jgi:hypothetical protein